MSDFLERAVSAHEQWKSRLRSAIQGGGILDATTARSDNRCELGNWIYGEQSAPFQSLPEFADLKTKHARFHLLAATLVTLINGGAVARALKELDTGEYPRASCEVVHAIEALKQRLPRE
jgi:aerotaxis receptor